MNEVLARHGLWIVFGSLQALPSTLLHERVWSSLLQIAAEAGM